MKTTITALCALLVTGYFATANTAYAGPPHPGHKIREGMRDTGDALLVTPSVKAAIIGDHQLNDHRNRINVDTKDYVVRLRGHVYNRQLKVRAASVAAHRLQQMHKRYHIDNELAITH